VEDVKVPKDLAELAYVLAKFKGIHIKSSFIDYRGAYIFIKVDEVEDLRPILKVLPRSLAGFQRWTCTAEHIEIEPTVVFKISYKFRLLSENREQRGERFYEDVRALASSLAESWKP
jgi:hypothetical protein